MQILTVLIRVWLYLRNMPLHRNGLKASTRKFSSSRREEYAEATKQAIIEAARRLFSEQGYFATKVDEIAVRARVAPATVYAVAGGKQGLLRTMIETWAAAPIIATAQDGIEDQDNPAVILSLVASSCRRIREEFGDIMRVMLSTAPHDREVAESLAMATARYRQAFLPIGRRLLALGGLRNGMDVDQAVDILWFYFGYSALFCLRDENGWSYDRAELWLRQEATRALLEPR